MQAWKAVLPTGMSPATEGHGGGLNSRIPADPAPAFMAGTVSLSLLRSPARPGAPAEFPSIPPEPAAPRDAGRRSVAALSRYGRLASDRHVAGPAVDTDPKRNSPDSAEWA
ncbi:hypothetical protein GCM10027514_34060 [Azotobacter armeniacus]